MGSNNWAVTPSRSATGHALLAGDPHLDLTLPSIWYEAHLVVRPAVPPSRRPADLDVYGVTIPGAPPIVIGFNRDLAWTYTAAEADVADYYQETIDDPAAPKGYLLDGDWKPLESRVETYRDQQGRALAADTVYATHRGPLVRFGDRWLSLRWTVLESRSELAALLAGAEARTADEWLTATRDWSAPALNMVVADRRGTIAIRSAGRIPMRPAVPPSRRPADGTRILDGTRSQSDWLADLPVARQPFVRNPSRGFVASNNQQPLDPRADPTYLGANWEAPWRALRINGLLRDDSRVTADDVRRWQTDPGSARADFFVPHFLRAVGMAAPAGLLLAQWDRRYTRDNSRAILFELAMDRLAALTWDELEDSTGRRVATPRDVMLGNLMQDSGSVWWDRRATTGIRENRDAILRLALTQAAQEATRQHGDPNAGGWRWDRVRHANIHHLLRIPAFSALNLPIQGGRSTLNPSSDDGTQGASWRMVVDLGPELTAWGTYPGGQSGNPVSPRYLDRLPKWMAGELDTLRAPRTADDLAPGRTSARLELVPEP